ncbi:DUF2252_family protein [Hexamita inflata]|uniref:DUF2252 family protein n=1 Tax=Hexamita inflata TaxID=28002 RepID=A0AA86U152_9EUKA|nr:DUF2252 family protein [Hexamita inflata]
MSSNSNINIKQLDILQEYDKAMIKKFQNLIKDDSLTFKNNIELTSLNFIEILNIKTLVLENCYNIIPILQSQTITDLQIQRCNIHSFKKFQLDKLEVLIFYSSKKKETKLLAKEIEKYTKLLEIRLVGCMVDIQYISNIIKLIKLTINWCDLLNTQKIKTLVNLQELSLNFCQEVDITSLQYLRQLIKLSLQQCNIVSIDPLRPLSKLQELNISDNKLVYLQPILELKQLSTLYTANNKIVDTKIISQQSSIQNFDLGNQNRPSLEELRVAGVVKDIQNQIANLRSISQQTMNLKCKRSNFRYEIARKLQNQYYVQNIFYQQIIFINNIEDIQ